MKKIFTILLLLPVLDNCAASSDARLQGFMALLNFNPLTPPVISKQELASAKVSGGKISITSSSVGSASQLVSSRIDYSYALEKWTTMSGKLSALAVYVRSNRSVESQELHSDEICKVFASLCSQKFKTSPGEETLAKTQEQIDEILRAKEITEGSVGKDLFVSGILVQNDKRYTFMGHEGFSKIGLIGGRNVRELKDEYSQDFGTLSLSWYPDKIS